jgi:hypothetical protein
MYVTYVWSRLNATYSSLPLCEGQEDWTLAYVPALGFQILLPLIRLNSSRVIL